MITKKYHVTMTCDYKQQAGAERCNHTLEYTYDSVDICITKARKEGWLIDEVSNIHVCPLHTKEHFGGSGVLLSSAFKSS